MPHLAFVIPPKAAPGWILEAICREVDAFVEHETTKTHAYEFPLPPAAAYFFSHYDYFRAALLQAEPRDGQSIVFFTHPKDLGISQEECAFVLSKADHLVSMCRLFADWMVGLGVPAEKIHVATVGADPTVFQPHTRSTGAVGLCTAYYDRKSPEKILELVRAMPHRKFMLLGRNWRQWSRFPELCSLENFQYEERPYAEYPRFYDEIDVFVTVSRLEGGPVPLVEAMMSNVVPVASRTGIAPDIVVHGENGFLFDVDASVEEIAGYIEKAYETSTDVRATVRHLTWERFSRQIQAIAGLQDGGEENDSRVRVAKNLARCL